MQFGADRNDRATGLEPSAMGIGPRQAGRIAPSRTRFGGDRRNSHEVGDVGVSDKVDYKKVGAFSTLRKT